MRKRCSLTGCLHKRFDFVEFGRDENDRLWALFHRGLHGGLFGFTKGFAHFNEGFQFVEFGRSVGNGIQPAPPLTMTSETMLP